MFCLTSSEKMRFVILVFGFLPGYQAKVGGLVIAAFLPGEVGDFVYQGFVLYYFVGNLVVRVVKAFD